MGYLIDKLIKYKKLQKLSTSYVLIIPNNWIEEMNWDRETVFKVVWRPDDRQIIITQDNTKQQQNEEISKPQPESN
jgi:hypothetical protein